MSKKEKEGKKPNGTTNGAEQPPACMHNGGACISNWHTKYSGKREREKERKREREKERERAKKGEREREKEREIEKNRQAESHHLP